MFRRLSLTFLALAIFGVAGRQATASFTFINDSSISGSGLGLTSSNGSNLTVDNDTNLQWLDVSVTRGLTTAQVLGLIDSGPLQGFRYATTAELSEFMSKNGIAVPDFSVGAAAVPKVANAEAFAHIWGGDFQDTFFTGLSSNEFRTSDGAILMFYGEINGLTYFEVFPDSFGFGDLNNTGSALVRTSAVIPEPNSVLLFVLGSCMMPYLRMRRG